MDEININAKYDRSKVLLYVLVYFIMAGGFLAMLVSRNPFEFGWDFKNITSVIASLIGIPFSLFFGTYFLLEIVKNKVQLRITSEGISLRNLDMQTIYWNEISHLKTKTKPIKMTYIILKDPMSFIGRTNLGSKVNKALMRNAIPISAQTLNVEEDDLIEVVNYYLDGPKTETEF